MASRYEFEVAVDLPAATVWSSFVQSAHLVLPSSLPGCYAAIEYPDDVPPASTHPSQTATPNSNCWCDQGSVRLVKCVQGCCLNQYTKEKLEEVDHKNFIAKWSIIEGGTLGKYATSQINTMQVIPQEGVIDNSCIVQFIIEYVKAGNSDFKEQYKEEITRALQSIKPYLQSNPISVTTCC